MISLMKRWVCLKPGCFRFEFGSVLRVVASWQHVTGQRLEESHFGVTGVSWTFMSRHFVRNVCITGTPTFVQKRAISGRLTRSGPPLRWKIWSELISARAPTYSQMDF